MLVRANTQPWAALLHRPLVPHTIEQCLQFEIILKPGSLKNRISVRLIIYNTSAIEYR